MGKYKHRGKHDMSKKPFTVNDCPLQAGSVVREIATNTDYVVTGRRLDWSEQELFPADLQLVQINGVWYTGNQLVNKFTYYPNWPVTDEYYCFH